MIFINQTVEKLYVIKKNSYVLALNFDDEVEGVEVISFVAACELWYFIEILNSTKSTRLRPQKSSRPMQKWKNIHTLTHSHQTFSIIRGNSEMFQDQHCLVLDELACDRTFLLCACGPRSEYNNAKPTMQTHKWNNDNDSAGTTTSPGKIYALSFFSLNLTQCHIAFTYFLLLVVVAAIHFFFASHSSYSILRSVGYIYTVNRRTWFSNLIRIDPLRSPHPQYTHTQSHVRTDAKAAPLSPSLPQRGNFSKLSLSRMRHTIVLHIKFYRLRYCFTPTYELAIGVGRDFSPFPIPSHVRAFASHNSVIYLCTILMTQTRSTHVFASCSLTTLCVCVQMRNSIGRKPAVCCVVHVAADLYAASNGESQRVDGSGMAQVRFVRNAQRWLCMPCRTPHSYRNWIFNHIRFGSLLFRIYIQQPFSSPSVVDAVCRWQCFYVRILRARRTYNTTMATIDDEVPKEGGCVSTFAGIFVSGVCARAFPTSGCS